MIMRKQDIIAEYELVIDGYIMEMERLDTKVIEDQLRLEELNNEMRLELDRKMSFIERYNDAKERKESEAGDEI